MSKKRRHPNVTSFKDRHGKLRWRYRKIGRPTHYFTCPPDTPGFVEELAACEATVPIRPGAGRCIPRSVHDLVARYYQSADFNNGGDADQHRRRLLLEGFRTAFGDDLVENFGFQHIEAILLERSKKKSVGNRTVGGKVAAQSLRKQLRRLFAHAKRLGWIATNPVEEAGRIKGPRSSGYHTWTEAEIRQYQARHPIGSRARLALEIMLWTWQRRGDARLFGPEHLKSGRIEYRQGKTGKALCLTAAPQLVEAINATRPVGLKAYLVTDFGKPFSAAGFGNKMREWCDQAGLPHCTAHGLRKAGARRAAEQQAGNPGIKAVGGWSGDAEVATYTAAVDQAALADATLKRVIAADLANLEDRLAKLKADVSEK